LTQNEMEKQIKEILNGILEKLNMETPSLESKRAPQTRCKEDILP
jgi:hypothetical protein